MFWFFLRVDAWCAGSNGVLPHHNWVRGSLFSLGSICLHSRWPKCGFNSVPAESPSTATLTAFRRSRTRPATSRPASTRTSFSMCLPTVRLLFRLVSVLVLFWFCVDCKFSCCAAKCFCLPRVAVLFHTRLGSEVLCCSCSFSLFARASL